MDNFGVIYKILRTLERFMDADVFLLMAKNHYVDELQQTEDGREYLEKCKRLRITEIDEQALRSRYDF